MSDHWATEHLQTIRTLMERSALYRRALAPTALVVGIAGVVGGAVGLGAPIRSDYAFVVHWLVVAAASMGGAFFVVRRQAVEAGESFWSPPARRVAVAMLPACVAGAFLALLAVRLEFPQGVARFVPGMWMILYGCALHAAGFFMQRGIRLFGWGFVFAGAAALWGLLVMRLELPGGAAQSGHALMGAAFGLGHLAYATYLHLTERKNDA